MKVSENIYYKTCKIDKFNNVVGSTYTNQELFKYTRKQTYREGDHGTTPIYNNLKESKISRNKHNQEIKELYNESFTPPKKVTK